jgi:hypothetical protein
MRCNARDGRAVPSQGGIGIIATRDEIGALRSYSAISCGMPPPELTPLSITLMTGFAMRKVLVMLHRDCTLPVRQRPPEGAQIGQRPPATLGTPRFTTQGCGQGGSCHAVLLLLLLCCCRCCRHTLPRGQHWCSVWKQQRCQQRHHWPGAP